MGAKNVVITISSTKLAPTTEPKRWLHGAVQVLHVKGHVGHVDEELTGHAQRDVEDVVASESPLVREMRADSRSGRRSRSRAPKPIQRPISPVAFAHHGGDGGVREGAESTRVVGQGHADELEDRAEDLTGEETDEGRQHDGHHSRSLDCFGVDQRIHRE